MFREKLIFISHSSEDVLFANKVCEVFEANGLPCWIAPRDIPYGNVWAGEITQAIASAKIMIFIFSNHSNLSNEVISEINLARQYGLKIITIKLTDQPYNTALNYYLSTFHWVRMEEDVDRNELLRIVDRFKLYMRDGDESLLLVSDEALSEGREMGALHSNIDDFLDTYYQTVRDTPDEEINPFKKKLLQRMGCRIVAGMAPPESLESDSSSALDKNAECENEAPRDKWFTLEKGDADIIAFLVRIKIDMSDQTQSFCTEEIEAENTESDRGTQQILFHVRNADSIGDPMVFLIFPSNSNDVFVTCGFLADDAVIISKKPIHLSSENKIRCDDIINRVEANPDGRNVIIDPISRTILPRQKYYDRKAKKWIHYYEMFSHRSYFAFAISAADLPGKSGSLASSYNIGFGYYWGCYGLEKNILEAAIWFERSATAKGYLYLSRIFREDPLLANEEDAEYYEKKYSELVGEE